MTAELTPAQVRRLRSLGHGLRPKVSVGRAGLSEPVLRSLEEAFHTSELVKARLERSCELDRGEAGRLLAEAAGAHLVKVLGRTVLLYRPDGESPKIQLP